MVSPFRFSQKSGNATPNGLIVQPKDIGFPKVAGSREPTPWRSAGTAGTTAWRAGDSEGRGS